MIAEFSHSATPAEVREGMSRAFARPFGCWRKRVEGWVCDETGAAAPSPAWDKALGAVATAEPARSCVRQFDEAELFIGVRVVEIGGSETVVAGLAPSDPAVLATLLAQSAVSAEDASHHHADRDVLLTSYSEKLADTFEELAFLRKISQYVEYCDAANPLAEVAATMIPSLRELMRIEGLAFFRAECVGGQEPRVTHLAASDGKLRAAVDDWARIIDSLTQRDSRRIIVKNFPPLAARNTNPSPLTRVRSVVIAPVAKDDVIYGWLVGVNKIPDDPSALTPTNSLGFDEIGTMEATLLQSAASLLATHAANVALFQQHEQLVVDSIHTLVGVLEAKDAYTCGHSDRVALFGRRLAEELQLSPAQCHNIYLAGLLHDIGKVGVTDDVLMKPGSLTEDEFAEIRRHPETGWRLLYRLKPLRHLLPAVLHHHEAMDGSGYPYGLAGEFVPLAARILAVADAFDAMTSDRPYREGMPVERAESILREGRGKQWDAAVVDAFFAARDDIREIMKNWHDHLTGILSPPWQADAKSSGAMPRKPDAEAALLAELTAP